MSNQPRRLAVGVALVAVPIVLLYLDDWVELVGKWWSDPNYTHGFFVPLFALYFVWEKWDRLKAAPLERSWLGLPALLLGIGVKLWTLVYDSLFIACGSMILVTSGALLLVAGRRVFRVAAVPVLFLMLMVPLPTAIYERIALPLQHLAAFVSTAVLRGLGILALQEGNTIVLSRRELEVAEACSGMRSVTGYVALGVAFAYLCRRPIWERIVLVASTVPIAIAVNVVRVTGIALMAHWGHDSFVDGPSHAATALVLFALSALVLWLEYYVLSHLFLPVERLGSRAALERT